MGHLLQAARATAAAARDTADTVQPPESRDKALAYVVEVLADEREAPAARLVINEARAAALAIQDPSRRSAALTQVARALAAGGDSQGARDAANSLDNPRERDLALAAVANVLSAAGNASAVRMVTDGIEDPQVRSQALLSFAEALAQAGDDAAARRTATATRASVDVIPDAEGRALALGRIAVLAGDTPAAREAAVAAQAAGDRIEDPAARAYALAWIAEVLAGIGDVQTAREAAAAARSAALGSSTLWRASSLHRVAEALAALDDPVAARATAEAIEGARPRENALARVDTILSGKGTAPTTPEAMTFARAAALTDPVLRARSLAMVAVEQATANNAPLARQAAAAARSAANIITDPFQRVDAQVQVARALAFAGDVRAALEVASAGEVAAADLGYVKSPLRILAADLVAADDTESARAAADLLKSPVERVYSLTYISKALASKGDTPGAHQTAMAAWVTAQAIWHWWYRPLMLHEVTRALAAAGDVTGARVAADANPQPNASLTHIAVVLATAGDTAAALNTANAIKDPDALSRAQARVAIALARVAGTGAAEDGEADGFNDGLDTPIHESPAPDNGRLRPPVAAPPDASRGVPSSGLTPGTTDGDAGESRRPAQNRSDGWCYIATAIYGSYDCPEVWVLRRFRDETLVPRFLGRVLVRTYYFVSPRALKVVGSNIDAVGRRPLDALVRRLRERGYSDDPYRDAVDR